MDFKDERIIAGNASDADNWQYSLRPRLLSEYIGQKKVKENTGAEMTAFPAGKPEIKVNPAYFEKVGRPVPVPDVPETKAAPEPEPAQEAPQEAAEQPPAETPAGVPVDENGDAADAGEAPPAEEKPKSLFANLAKPRND